MNTRGCLFLAIFKNLQGCIMLSPANDTAETTISVVMYANLGAARLSKILPVGVPDVPN
jgi:hypothetical protein